MIPGEKAPATAHNLSPDVCIIHGDCISVIPQLSRVDAIVCDPPYSSGGLLRGDRMQTTSVKYQQSGVKTEHPQFTGDNRDQRGFTAWAAVWLSQCLDVSAPGAVCCLFSDWRQLPCVTDALQAGGWVWRGVVPWDKENARPMPNRFRSQCEYVVWGTNGPRSFKTDGATYHPGILRERAPSTGERVHTTQKPVGVMERIVEIAGMGGTVLDPFMGSGTTGIACIRACRKFIGIEKDAKYFEIAKNRLELEITPGGRLI